MDEAYFDPDEDEPEATHSGHTPHHRHHGHHRHHHGHDHHSGTTGADLHADHVTLQGDTHVTHQHVTNQAAAPVHSAPRGLGVREAIAHVLEAINALATRYERKTALGMALAKLVEQDRITGIGDVLAVAMGEVNRYSHVEHDQNYSPMSGVNRYR